MYELITIRFSHYNEKARWGLEYFDQPYKERPFMPVLHMPAVKWATRKGGDNRADKVSSPLSTPVLLRPDGDAICDSSRILAYLNERYGGETNLYPDDEVVELEQLFHDELGPHSRRVAYYYVLDDDSIMNELAQRNVGRLQQLVFRAAFPFGRTWMKSRMRIDDKGLRSSQDKIARCLDAVDEKLEDGRPYLVGDHFSAADMSLACMLVPALVIGPDEGFGAYLPSLEQAPPEFARYARELRERPSGRHALRMFAEERESARN